MKKDSLIKTLTITLSPDDYAYVRVKSEQLRITCAEYIRRALKERIEKDAKK